MNLHHPYCFYFLLLGNIFFLCLRWLENNLILENVIINLDLSMACVCLISQKKNEVTFCCGQKPKFDHTKVSRFFLFQIRQITWLSFNSL
jgi:hypothetical protein